MRRNIFYILLLLTTLNLSCSKEEETIIDTDILAAPQYDLPVGEEGSVDNLIYNIHETYGSYILYDFDEADFTYLWSGKWNKYYEPADLSNDLGYVRMIIEAIDEFIFQVYSEDFVRENFPYKVFLTSYLLDYYEYNEDKEVTMLSNDHNAIAIGNVCDELDLYEESDWNSFGVDIIKLFAEFYYYNLPSYPDEFVALGPPNYTFSYLTDVLGVYAMYKNSCYTAGVVDGWLGSTYITPSDDKDYASFMAFLISTTKTEMDYIFSRYSLMKSRALALVPFLEEVIGLDVVAAQNKNVPEDPIPADYFDTL